MKETIISIRVSPEEQEEWKKKAEEQGLSFTDFVKEAVEIRAGFTKYFSDRLKNFSKLMNVSESIVLQNLVISWMARNIAETEVFPEKDMLWEFMFSSDGVITGEILYDNLYRNFVRDYETEKEVILKAYPDQTLPAKK